LVATGIEIDHRIYYIGGGVPPVSGELSI